MNLSDNQAPKRAAGAVLVIVLLLTAATMLLCGGRFVYTLDDPYISLGLGWHIAHGHYGLNAAELASPSSSILYPLLLAAFAWSSIQEWVPLLINSAAAAATAALLVTICGHYSIGTHQDHRGRNIFLIVLLCLAANIIGVVFTGLEHSLHILTSVAVIYGLALTLESDTVPPWLVAALVMNPLWRFEGVALTGLALLALAVHGHIRTALLGFILSAAALGAYMMLMSSMGLPLLPSSVLIKAAIFAPGATGTAHALHTIKSGLSGAWRYSLHAIPLWVQLVLVLLHPLLRARGWVTGDRGHGLPWRRELTFVSVITGAVIGHAFFGAWGWWYRYEIYLVAATTCGVIVLWHAEIAGFVQCARGPAIGYTVLAALCLATSYLRGTLMTPLAARGVYEQQYQMHRFVIDFYRQPVAVNDVGWVSYGNRDYVLDLWGLGSEAARKARLLDHKMGWLDELTRSHGVGLAMIYSSWFAEDIPSNWRPLAVLRGAHRRISAAEDEVTFYATSTSAEASALAALHAFGSQISPGIATLTFKADLSALPGIGLNDSASDL